MQVATSEKSVSLVQLVLSEQCKDLLLVNYLRRHLDDQQVLSALFKRISHLEQRSLCDILPNIICIYRNTRSKPLERFLYKSCEKSHTVYLTIRWAFRAYNEDGHSEQDFQTALNNMDSSVMNKYQLDCNIIPKQLLSARIEQFVQLKDHESVRTILTNQFYSHLTSITWKLKDVGLNDRQNQLKLALERSHQKFLSSVGQRASRCLPGMYFPLPCASNFVVGINYEYCFSFSTKMRVPYKLVFETVDYQELRKSEKQKQQLTKSVFKAMAVQTPQDCDSDSTKSNEDNSKIQKQTAQKINEYIKKYANSEETKVENRFLKTNQQYFQGQWKQRMSKIAEQSVYGGLKSHRVRSFMVKGGDDMRQEFFAMQLLKQSKTIFKDSGLKLWLKTYDIIIFTSNSGFIEFLPDTMTVSSLKKIGNGSSFKLIYKHLFGNRLDHAIKNFIVSLAGYCVVQYVFQIKDRHNGNIMIDSEGHMIHIDFGFFLGSSPGNMNFQKAPFKLTQDYIDLMEGSDSQYYSFFKQLLFMGFCFLKDYVKQVTNLIQVMGEKSTLPCFKYYREKDIRYRMMQNCTDSEIKDRVDQLLYDSANSNYTKQYDRFQWYTNGIYR